MSKIDNNLENEELFEVVDSRPLNNHRLLKRLVTLGMAIVLSGNLLITSAFAASPKYPDVCINDEQVLFNLGVSPYVTEQGVTYVPLEPLIKGRGYVTYRDTAKKTINSGCEYGTLYIKEGENAFTFNGSKYEMNGPVVITNGVIFVPVNVVATALYAKTEWNDETYRVNFVTNEKKVDEARIKKLEDAISDNKNLTYSEKSTVKAYMKKYVEIMDPDLDETDRMFEVLSNLDVTTKYNGSKEAYFTIKKFEVKINGSRTGSISSNDMLRNALTRMFNGSDETLFRYGMSELISAEVNSENTNQDLDMVNICKMLADIIGKDTLLKAYRDKDMSVVKNALLAIYPDEALYDDLVDEIERIHVYETANSTDVAITGMSKTQMDKAHKESVQHLYGILDVYYQCAFGFVITLDDQMEGYYDELLTYGSKKSFKTEPRIFNEKLVEDYVTIYNTPQSGYNYGYSSYKYYTSRRPINFKGNGQVLLLD